MSFGYWSASVEVTPTVNEMVELLLLPAQNSLFPQLLLTINAPLSPPERPVFEPPPEKWRRPPGWPCTTWMKNIHDVVSLLDLGIHEARDLVQNHRPLCRVMSLHSATHS